MVATTAAHRCVKPRTTTEGRAQPRVVLPLGGRCSRPRAATWGCAEPRAARQQHAIPQRIAFPVLGSSSTPLNLQYHFVISPHHLCSWQDDNPWKSAIPSVSQRGGAIGENCASMRHGCWETMAELV